MLNLFVQIVDLAKSPPAKVVFRLLEPEALLADFASRKKSASASGSLLSSGFAKVPVIKGA